MLGLELQEWATTKTMSLPWEITLFLLLVLLFLLRDEIDHFELEHL
jgi:hypothetical protein